MAHPHREEARTVALKRVAMPSPNYSSRGGATVRLIVLHTAEGARTYQELGNFFASPSSGVSSHVGIDDTPNTVGEYVRPDYKAWTQGNANPVSVSVELCAFAEWSTEEWHKHPQMLSNVALWIKEESKRFGVPITKLTSSQAQGSGRGVCQHADLGAWGGGHWDCGGGFPMDYVLNMARDPSPAPSPTPPTPDEEPEMGYPDWYWSWSNWYLTSNRDPDTRPKSAPEDIPQWAWEANEQQLNLLRRYGMTTSERDWIDWYLGGKKGQRPDVPQDIPDRWWQDQKWAAQRG